jgi:hypothetical protein
VGTNTRTLLVPALVGAALLIPGSAFAHRAGVAHVSRAKAQLAASSVRSATPGRRTTIRGRKVVWVARVSGRAPRRIVFRIDGGRRWVDHTRPFRFRGDRGFLDTTRLSNGPHSLTVVSIYRKARKVSSIRVRVANQARRKPKQNHPPAPAPTQPTPTQPTSPSASLQATAVDYGHVNLSWTAVSGASSYRVYRDGTLVAITSSTSAADAVLWPQTSYGYRIDALSGSTVLASFRTSVATPALPASGYPRPFAATSVWNTPVGDTASVANSSALIAYLQANLNWPNIPLHDWAVSVAEATSSSPSFDIPCTVYSCTLSAFGAVPVPLTAAPDPSADGHLAVYDPATQREWGMWQAKKEGIGWSASAGEAISTSGPGLVAGGSASSNAANFPLIAGLVRPEEILQGHIDHALVFTMPGVSNAGHVCPASHNDGSSSDPNALKEGMRLQLDPSIDVSELSIPAWEKTIARALQVYGMYLRDEGGTVAIMAENPASRGYDAWAKVGLRGNSISLSGIPWDRFRVVSAPC